MTKLSSKTKGVFYIILAAFGFSLMSMFIKLAGDLPSFQKAFFRNFIALIFIFIMMLRDKTGFVPAKKNIPDLFGRCFFGTLGMLCNFYAIGKLNLSDANMLNKLSPFFAIIFSVILLKERPSIVQIAGVCVAFAGSMCIIKPGFDNPEVLAAVAGLLGGNSLYFRAPPRLKKRGQQADNLLVLCVFVRAVSAVYDSGLQAYERYAAYLSRPRGDFRLRRSDRNNSGVYLRAGEGDFGL